MNNPDKLPVILSMTCLDGYWLYPGINSLAKVFLISEDKGAIATFSPTGLGVATGHDALQRGFFNAMNNKGEWELGEVSLAAKMALFAINDNFDLMHTFTIFGDPALQIATPNEGSLTPATAQDSGQAGESIQYGLQLKNLGLVTDTFTVTLSGNAWNASSTKYVIGPLAPSASSSFNITVNIPPSAQVNDMDVLIVQATSSSDNFKTDTSQLTTTVDSYKTYIPIIIGP
jgi:hypothetical protein